MKTVKFQSKYAEQVVIMQSKRSAIFIVHLVLLSLSWLLQMSDGRGKSLYYVTAIANLHNLNL